LSAIESASGGILSTRADSNPFGGTRMFRTHGFDDTQECLPHHMTDRNAGMSAPPHDRQDHRTANVATMRRYTHSSAAPTFSLQSD
jgi:hypothetical protein